MLSDRGGIQSSIPANEAPRLRIGLAGSGPWAEEIHLPVLCSHPDLFFAGIWSPEASEARRLAEAACARTFDSYEAMLQSVDAVSFAVAPNAQPALAKRAASSGRLLLLEKPLALSLQEGESLVAAIAQAKVASVVFFTRRFEPKVASALAAIAEERTWLSASACFLSGAMRPGSPYASSAWRQRYGALWDIGPHVLSMLLPVLGNVAIVDASREEPKITRLRMTHVNGGTSAVVLSVHAEPEQQGESYVFRSGHHVAKLDVRLATTVRQSAYAKAFESLVLASKTGLPHACDASFGLGILKILLAAETSLASNVPTPVAA